MKNSATQNSSAQNRFASGSASGGFPASSEFESTLRLIASLPAPEGLAERVEVGLRALPAMASGGSSSKARILAWPGTLRMDNTWMRSAAAAAIVLVVAGGGWGVYSRVQPNPPRRGIALPHVGAPGEFQGAGAMRTPQTLHGPVVEAPAAAHPAAAEPASGPAAQKTPAPLRRGKSAAAGESAARTAK